MGVEWGSVRNGSTRGRPGRLKPAALLSLTPLSFEQHGRQGEATHLYDHDAASLAALRRITRRARRSLAGPAPGA